MEENKIFEKLSENLYNLENVDNEICMVELAIYQKNTEKLKDIKLKNYEKILDITSTTRGIIKQMEETKQQISIRYRQKTCA